MAEHSGIEWTESTWNPLTGCTKISPGCKHCYAERMAKRLQAMGQANYVNGFKLSLHENAMEKPLEWKKPQVIFVNSMSDLFHKDVPVEFVLEIFDVMRRAHWHTFQVLTKRAERLEELSPKIDWPENVWMGVSVENQDYTFRIDHLRRTDAKTKFLSLEPLLGPLHKLNLAGIQWAIVGGESGPGARPLDPAWVTDIRDQCLRAQVPVFLQASGAGAEEEGGRTSKAAHGTRCPEIGSGHNKEKPVRDGLAFSFHPPALPRSGTKRTGSRVSCEKVPALRRQNSSTWQSGSPTGRIMRPGSAS